MFIYQPINGFTEIRRGSLARISGGGGGRRRGGGAGMHEVVHAGVPGVRMDDGKSVC